MRAYSDALRDERLAPGARAEVAQALATCAGKTARRPDGARYSASLAPASLGARARRSSARPERGAGRPISTHFYFSSVFAQIE